jgi:hypothetical protein
MTLPTLYAISDQYLQDVSKLQDMDLDEQTIADTLEGLQGDMEVKATNVAMFVRNLESLADQIKAAEAQMSARRKAIETRAERVRTYLLSNMQRTGITKIESPYFVLSVRSNPPKVVIDDPEAVPDEYWRQPAIPLPELDKKAIAAAIKAGSTVAGAHTESGVSLSIK